MDRRQDFLRLCCYNSQTSGQHVNITDYKLQQYVYVMEGEREREEAEGHVEISKH